MLPLALLRPAAPGTPPGGSIGWLLVALVVLALIVASGLILSSRR